MLRSRQPSHSEPFESDPDNFMRIAEISGWSFSRYLFAMILRVVAELEPAKGEDHVISL